MNGCVVVARKHVIPLRDKWETCSAVTAEANIPCRGRRCTNELGAHKRVRQMHKRSWLAGSTEINAVTEHNFNFLPPLAQGRPYLSNWMVSPSIRNTFIT